MSRTKHHKKRALKPSWYEELWGNIDLHNMLGKMYRGLRGCGKKNKKVYHQLIRTKLKRKLKKEI